MSKTAFKLSAVVVTSILVIGCANMTEAQKSSGLGAAMGCAGGAVLAQVTGRNATNGCAIGAAAGAVIGYIEGRKQDVAMAERARTEILSVTRGTGTEVQLAKQQQIIPEKERASANGAQSVEAVEKMIIQVPNALVSKKDDRATYAFNRVGGYVSSAHVPAIVTVNARNDQDFNYIVQKIRSGYVAGSNPEPGKVRFVYSELKRGSQASVEVAHAHV